MQSESNKGLLIRKAEKKDVSLILFFINKLAEYEKLAALAVERKCGRLEWAVLDWNEPSIEFYKSHGQDDG